MTNGQDLVPAILAMCETTAARGATTRVGLDVVSIAWFARQVRHKEDTAFVRTAFTQEERAYCAGHPERFAVRWAAKEAVAKAVGTGFRGLRPGDIEIRHHSDGRVSVGATEGSVWPHEAHSWRWALTLCHEGDAAIAVAVGSVQGTTSPRADVGDIPLATESK